MIDFPVDTIFAEARKNIHLHCLVVAAENSCESVFERNDSTIEDTV